MPSFIVTLASFFTFRGVMLVISKRLVGKVQVDQITKQKGATFFKNWIAHEWKFTEFGVRDNLFLGLVIAGGAAFIYGLLEQSFIRRVASGHWACCSPSSACSARPPDSPACCGPTPCRATRSTA